VQPQAGHQDGGHRHQGDGVAALVQPRPQHRPFVAAEQALDTRFSAIGLTFQVSPLR
jgi:hypothetical protein